MIENAPIEEGFSPRYNVERRRAQQAMPENLAFVSRRLPQTSMARLVEFEAFYPRIPLPRTLRIFRRDAYFAEQRIAGLNPVVLRRATANDLSAATAKAIDAAGVVAENVADRVARGEVFIADYRDILGVVRGGRHDLGQKFCPKPRAFHVWRSSGYREWGALEPLAIEVPASAGKERVFTPASHPVHWFIAKTAVQVADANAHEMGTHLGRTHVSLEAFAWVTPQTLGENHLVARLLQPHLRFLIVSKELGRDFLANQAGPVENLLAGPPEESLTLVRRSHKSWHPFKSNFVNDMATRGLTDAGDGRFVLPHYPYRDDGVLLWKAITEFVTAYLAASYGDKKERDARVAADPELAAWARMLGADRRDGGAEVPGMPTSFSTFDALVEVIVTLVFALGPGHSAVNFPQYDCLGFVPNQPLAAYRDFPDCLEDQSSKLDESAILAYLPPFRHAVGHLQVVEKFTKYRFDSMGSYDDDELGASASVGTEAAVTRAIAMFGAALHAAEVKIAGRNRSRPFVYPCMRPSMILNSPSI